jgi:hypothetical protein
MATENITITPEQINAIKHDRDLLIRLMNQTDNEKFRRDCQCHIYGIEAALRHLGVEF